MLIQKVRILEVLMSVILVALILSETLQLYLQSSYIIEMRLFGIRLENKVS